MYIRRNSMEIMVRTQIYLRPDEQRKLKTEAKKLKIRKAELIRRIIDKHYEASEITEGSD